jgi:serine/threonine protein kinase
VSAQRHQRAKEIFLEVCDLEPHARIPLLDERCAGDAELRAAVERLLRDDHDSLDLGDGERRGQLERLLADAERSSGEPPFDLDELPDYRIIRCIGGGGFGSVYEAEQLAPVKRLVALKTIKLGMDTRQVLARFRAERRVLAMLDHPSIARILDAQMSPSGRPFFTMELVRGQPITDYCEKARLGLPARLELFVSVCRAVHYAHQKSVVHRDLKPSNVLVQVIDGLPVAKVIDFGIAKLLEEGAPGGATLVTEQGQFLGTPEYMSPEQATTGERQIDTRSDIYSLGVLLYELITGATPFDAHELRTKGLEEMLRVIRETPPPRPSTKVHERRIEQGGGDAARDAATVERVLRRDLDWIALKAIAKEPDRRYASASELAEDVQRYLAGDPVLARPPSALYRLRKLSHRHKTTLAIGGIAVTALLVGLVAALAGLMRANSEAKRARTEAKTTRALNDFLNDDLLAAVAPESAGIDVTMREVLDAASAHIEGRFAEEPQIEATLRMTLGKTYLSLGLALPAQRHLERAAELRVAALGADHPDTLEARHELARSFEYLEQCARAIEILTDTLDRRTRVLGPDHPQTLASMYLLATAYGDLGRNDEAERCFLAARDGCRRALGEGDPQTLEAEHGLGLFYDVTERHQLAKETILAALEQSAVALGEDHPATIQRRNDLARVLFSLGEYEETRDRCLELIDRCIAVCGEHHPTVSKIAGNLASAYLALDQPERALPFARQGVEVMRHAFPNGHADLGRSLYLLAHTYQHLGRLEEAEQNYLESVQVMRSHLGDTHADTLTAIGGLVNFYRSRGDSARAAEWARLLPGR